MKSGSLGFAYKFVNKQLPLTKAHKAARLRFAEKHLTVQTDWTKIVFSDEKKFQKDGPDNQGSLHDLNPRAKAAPHRLKRQNGGGGVMVLGAMASNEKIEQNNEF